MLDIKEAIKGNKNYGYDDLGLLSLPLSFIDSGAYIRVFEVNCLFLPFNHRRTGRGGGGRGRLQPPQILGNSDFLGSTREFLKTSSCFYYYFEEMNIF